MSEDTQLLSAFDRFTAAQRRAVRAQFEALMKAYPHKCYHPAGYTDLWLTAIADVRDHGEAVVGGGTVAMMDSRDLRRLVELAEIAYHNKLIEETTIIDVRRAGEDAYAYWNLPVDEVEWSIRVRNCFRAYNIKTVGDLTKMTEPQLLRLGNFGRKSLHEVKHVLAALNLTLAKAT